MDIETRQIMEKNQRAKTSGIGILIFGFICCVIGLLAGKVELTGMAVFRSAAFPVILIGYLICYSKMKESKLFMHIGTYWLVLAYCILVLTTANTYMYAFVYLLMIYVVLYLDRVFTLRCAIGAALINVVAAIRYIILDKSSTDLAVIQCVFAFFAVVLAYNIVAIAEKHNRETLDAVAEKAAKEAEVGRQLIALSEQLAEKFEIAKDNAEAMTGNVSASFDAASEISESIKVTAESIEVQTSLTSDIQQHLEETKDETGKMKEAADESTTAVQAGKEAMEALAEQAQITGRLNKESQEITEELGQRIEDVESFTAEILNISNQTNLLALNASIEAARAGEAGRGFAVVADEIRQLSDQTKSSVNKITEIIGRLVSNSKAASDSMSKSIVATDEQNGMIENAIRNIDLIESKNEILLSLMSQITERIADILKANTQINDSISNLSAMSEQVAASSENSREVMEASMTSVQSLNELLNEIFEISLKMSELTKG